MSPQQHDDDPVLDDQALRALANALPPAELSAEQRNSMRARVMARATDVAPPGTETIRGEDVQWRQAWPGVWIKVLKHDAAADLQITLMKLEPGGRIPSHDHRRDEECFVLEGEVLVGTHPVRAGDFHIARAGGQHPELFSRQGALVILRSQHY